MFKLSRALRNPFIGAFVFAMVVLGLDFLIFWVVFGGWVDFDTECQWRQVQSGMYNDWHPFVHTFLMMKLPSFFWNDYRVTILWQILLLAVAFGYAQWTLAMAGVRGWRWWMPAVAIVHPLTLLFAMTPLKDSAFAIAVLLVFAQLIRLCFLRKAFFQSPLHLGLTALFMWLAISFRHNGVFFVLPALVLVVVVALREHSWRGGFALVLTVAALQMAVMPLLHANFHVKRASSHPREYLFLETNGLPLTMMGAVYVRHPAEISPQVASLMSSIQPLAIWRNAYEDGSFNLVKYANRSYIPDEAIGKIQCPPVFQWLRMVIETVRLDILASVKSAYALTGQVWNPFHATLPMVKDGFDRIGINNPQIVRMALLCSIFVFGLIAVIFWLAAWLSFRGLRRGSWVEILLAVPVLAYDFGTMCMLSGFNEYRLFFFNVVVAMPMLLVCSRCSKKGFAL